MISDDLIRTSTDLNAAGTRLQASHIGKPLTSIDVNQGNLGKRRGYVAVDLLAFDKTPPIRSRLRNFVPNAQKVHLGQ